MDYVYVATVGKTPEKVLVGLRSRLNIKKVCLVGSSDPEVRRCMEYIKDFSEKLGYGVEMVEADAFNVLDVADRVNEIIQQNKDTSAVVNISSGTRVMTIGALIAAYVNNSEVIYVPQHVDEKTPLYINLPALDWLLKRVTLPREVLIREEEVLPELVKRVKEDYPAIRGEALQQLIETMLKNKFEFNAWDTRFERYPTLVLIHEKTKTKTVREDVGPYQLLMHLDARCSRCQSWFTIPIKIGLGYIPTAALLGQGEVPPRPEEAPPPFRSHEYVDLLLKSQRDFYCPRCTLLLGLRNVINKLKSTQIIV